MSVVLNFKSHLSELFAQALREVAPDQSSATVLIERPKQVAHGDYACNLAMQLAKPLRKSPRDIAQALIAALPASEVIAKVEIAGAGFINLIITKAAKQAIVHAVLHAGAGYGHIHLGEGRKVQVEFVSANPTGPLHVGHGRGAAVGDCLCNVLHAAGWNVTREFYYNDAGVQIDNLTLSVQLRCKGITPDDPSRPESGYRGDYIQDVARSYMAKESVEADDQHTIGKGDVNDIEAIRHFAVAYLRREQDLDLRAFQVKFDVFSLESALYTEGKVAETVNKLIQSGHTYEQDNALWLRTTDFGDDKDRVMRKSDGGYTYFVPDVAYHVTKFERGYVRALDIQGSDHHGTVARVRAGLQAIGMGIPAGYPDYILHKMVTVMRGGLEVRISKRAGSYVTLRDLIDEVGRDAVRFFLVSRKADSEFVFDIDLTRSQSEENPVYYVQYAHARVAAVLRQAEIARDDAVARFRGVDLSPLTSAYEIPLLRRVADFPDELAAAAAEFAPHQLAFYLKDLAQEFHSYYNAERFLVDDLHLRNARLALVVAVGQVLANGLSIIGIDAP